MEMEVSIKKQVRYLKIDVAVRYQDEDMAFDAPLREGDTWKATIDLIEKKIIDWPEGKTLLFKDMKVCDEGIYTLLDADMKEIKKIEGYVPNQLLPGSYGDYLDMDIDEFGNIKNWKSSANLSDFEDFLK